MRYLISAVAVLLALTACSGEPTESDEYRALEKRLSATQEALDAAQTEVAGIATREQQMSDESDLLDGRRQVLIEQAGKLERFARRLVAREQKVEAAENQIAARTIAGEGVYRVGDDIEPGTYRSPSNRGSCYWSVNGDANGNDIVSNNYGGGPQLVEVVDGQFFETTGCGDWTRQ